VPKNNDVITIKWPVGASGQWRVSVTYIGHEDIIINKTRNLVELVTKRSWSAQRTLVSYRAASDLVWLLTPERQKVWPPN
jgi:hypothetical protein